MSNTIQIESKLNHEQKLRRTIKELASLPYSLRSGNTEAALSDLKDQLQKIEGVTGPMHLRHNRLLLINTMSGVHEVLVKGRSNVVTEHLERLMRTQELSDEPSTYKIELQVLHGANQWLPKLKLFAPSWKS